MDRKRLEEFLRHPGLLKAHSFCFWINIVSFCYGFFAQGDFFWRLWNFEIFLAKTVSETIHWLFLCCVKIKCPNQNSQDVSKRDSDPRCGKLREDSENWYWGRREKDAAVIELYLWFEITVRLCWDNGKLQALLRWVWLFPQVYFQNISEKGVSKRSVMIGFWAPGWGLAVTHCVWRRIERMEFSTEQDSFNWQRGNCSCSCLVLSRVQF